MAWFNAAGNSAGSGPNPGSYWRGTWTDADSDGWLDWVPGDELMALGCVGGSRFINGLRWSDWGANRTDYDLYLYDDPAATVLLSSGTSNRPPARCGSSSVETIADADYLAMHYVSPDRGPAATSSSSRSTARASSTGRTRPVPRCRPPRLSSSPGALAIGGIDPATGVVIAPYSFLGPNERCPGQARHQRSLVRHELHLRA